jgi:hypothetical protein
MLPAVVHVPAGGTVRQLAAAFQRSLCVGPPIRVFQIYWRLIQTKVVDSLPQRLADEVPLHRASAPARNDPTLPAKSDSPHRNVLVPGFTSGNWREAHPPDRKPTMRKHPSKPAAWMISLCPWVNLLFVWVCLTEQKWVISRRRRGPCQHRSGYANRAGTALSTGTID